MQVVDAFGTDYFNQKPNFTELIDASLYRCILSYAVSVRQCLLYHQVSINTIRHINVKPRQATTTILNVHFECTFSFQTAILDLVTMEDWGEEKICRSKCEVEKMGKGEGKENISSSPTPNPPPPIPPLRQPSTGQASNYNPRWRYRKPGL